MSNLLATDRSAPVRRKQRGTHDRATINTILDEALVCHVGFIHQGAPIVLPMAFVRVDDHVYLHGSTSNRMLNALDGQETCVTVTLVDALVLAKTAAHHSLNYRSATLFGRGRRVTDRQEQEAAFAAMVEATLPGRGSHTHAVESNDFKTTLLIAVAVEEGAAKVRTGPPADDPHAPEGFVGIVPLRQVADAAIGEGVPHISSVTRVHDQDALRQVLRRAYGWNDSSDQTVRARLTSYLSAQPEGWFEVRAQRDGGSAPELAAGGGCLVFSHVAYFGLVGVAPEFQRRGIARLLMQRLLRYANARGADTLLLDASASGEPLYRSMGFEGIDETLVFRGTLGTAPVRAVREVTERSAIFALDQEAYSADRSALLACTPGRVFVHSDGGYCIVHAGGVGPLVARTPEIAADLLDSAQSTGEVLTRASHSTMRALLHARGLVEVRRLTHMRLPLGLGSKAPYVPRSMVFAQLSLATG